MDLSEERRSKWDCGEHVAEIAKFITDCNQDYDSELQDCKEAAMEIFCTPVKAH